MSDPNISGLLEEESLDDSQVLDSDLQSPHRDLPNMVHSATTETLDSVALGPSEDFGTLEDVLTEEETSIKGNNSDVGIEILAGAKEPLESSVEVAKGSKDEYLQQSEIDELSGVNTTTIETGVEAGKVNSPEEVSISSYFMSGPDQEDPFGSVVRSPSIPIDMQGMVIKSPSTPSDTQTMPAKQIREDVTHVHHDPLESRISLEEPETVDFSVPEEEGDPNVMEASMQIIDDKEDFESFTAESGPTDLEAELGLGVSPSNKFLTERMNKMHIGDTSQGETFDLSRSDYSRQLSTSSSHSLGGFPASQQNLTPPVAPSPVHQPFQGNPFSSSQISPFSTPSHQPAFAEGQGQVTTSQALPPETSTEKQHAAMPPPPDTNTDASIPFTSLPSGMVEDPFTASLHMSDSDRQHDAWIPSETTRQFLVTMATSIPGTFIPTVDQLSCPGIIVDEPQGDPVRDLVYRYMGEQEAIKRKILTVDTVTQDVDGLKKLIAGGCYRSAVDLTRRLLSAAGQGPGKVGQVSQHSSHTLQLWFTRLILLMKLRLYSIAESELQAFQNLDTPDLYYEFYPHVYPGRKGSMVPFGMRVLHAELPHYMGRSQEALDRLYYVLAVVQKIINNLEKEYSEDGSALEISDESRKVSKGIWQEREKRVLYIIGNTFLAIRDYEASMAVYENLLSKDPACKAALLSGMGRLYLQMGNVEKAKDCFQHAEILSDSSDKTILCRNYINRGLESMCTNNFTEAYQNFKLAVNADPTNTSAVNNMAACSLYLGRLMDALKTLEVMVHDDPKRNLHEGVLFNLCTLYELESSRALHKKQALLDLVSRYKGDGFPVACLKMA